MAEPVDLAGPGSPEPRSLFAPSLWRVTVATLTAVSIVAFDGLAVAAALPRITEDLGDVEWLSGVLTGYLLATSVAVIAAGPIVDSVGVRRVFRIATVGFGAATLGCGLAPSMLGLVAARIVQGAFGGALITAAIATVGLAYPTRLRSRGFAANSTVWGTMSFLAPGLTALLLAVVGWRAVFLAGLPLVGAALVAGWNQLPDRLGEARVSRRLDPWGLVLLAVAITVMTLGLTRVGWWTLPCLVVAVASGAAYWYHAGRTADPVLERRWLAELPWWGINFGAALGFAAGLGVDAFITIYMSAAQGRSSFVVALSVVPLSIGWTGAALATSRLLDRFSETGMATAAFAILIPSLAAGGVLFTTDAPLWVVWAVTFAQGVGVGMLTNSMLTLLQNLAEPARIGRASSAHTFLRNSVHTLATAVAGAVLLAVVAGRLGDVDLVSRLVSGESVDVGAVGAQAVADGFRLGHVAAVATASVGLVAVRAARRNLAPARLARAAAARPASLSPGIPVLRTSYAAATRGP